LRRRIQVWDLKFPPGTELKSKAYDPQMTQINAEKTLNLYLRPSASSAEKKICFCAFASLQQMEFEFEI
jgi:hypothetical protein